MKKTNLDIIDQDSWNWVKNKKNYFELRSVANFIFKMIDVYRNLNIEKWLFLINLEKYFEYSYYDMEEFSYAMDLQTSKIIKLIDKYVGSNIQLFNLEDEELRKKTIKKIHDLMIENRILPRELSIAYNLRSFIDKNQLDISKYENLEKMEIFDVDVNNEKILLILFPNAEERRKEIYCESINFAESFIKFEEINNFECKECDEDCIMKRPDYIYYKSGIDVSYDDLEDDLVSEILKQNFKEDFIVCYGFCLTMAIASLIRKNLLMVKNFIKNELYIFEKPTEIMIFIDILIKISMKAAKSISRKREREHFDEMYNRLLELTP